METLQQQIRKQQKNEELCSATIRALSTCNDIHFRGGKLHKGLKRYPLYATHLQIDPEHNDYASYRGISDAIVLRLLHTDEALHSDLCPEDPVERLIFEWLEQLRVESLVPAHLPGMQQNLRQHFEHWSLQFHYSGLSDSGLGILLYTVAQISWARLNGWRVLEQTEDFIEATRAGIVPMIGSDLAGLRKQRKDQSAFAAHAKSMARILYHMMDQAQTEQGDDEEDQEWDNDATLKLLLDFEESDDDGIASALSGKSKVFEETDNGYQVFSRQYDREIKAASLVRPELLKTLREQLDKKVAEQGINIPRLARQLSALFALPERDGWRFGEEEGIIDGRRLSQLVSSPAERRLFKQEKFNPKANAMVSILVDCSGSMKQHIDSIATLVDSFTRAMELAHVSSEILGFTTGGWNGGRVMQQWMAAGRPKNPGRLNEVCYMVYKDAETIWRHARKPIAAMLKPDLFREGIDGEAVEWACRRLVAHNAWRKVLIVISDGCPMDTATNLANDKYYLDNHLKDVVQRHQVLGDTAIYGLGVGLDLSPFYPGNLSIDLSEGLNNRMFEEIVQMLSVGLRSLRKL